MNRDNRELRTLRPHKVKGTKEMSTISVSVRKHIAHVGTILAFILALIAFAPVGAPLAEAGGAASSGLPPQTLGSANALRVLGDEQWDDRFTPDDSVNNSMRAIAVSGSDVYVGGDFTTAGGVAASRIARWNGSAWSALGSEMNGFVHAIAVSGNDVYVGGDFTTAGGVAANYIAKWDGSSWSALGSGLNFAARAIAISGSDVYVGGGFTTAGGVPANRIARWDGSAWSALGSGVSSSAYAIAVEDSNVYVGGNFTQAGGAPANYVARWDGTSWYALGSGTDNVVLSIEVIGDFVYVGGSFTAAGGVVSRNIAKWNGSAWYALGSGLNGSNVHAIVESGLYLYVGGTFDQAGGTAANYIARWNTWGGNWSALGSGTNSIVQALAVSGSDVYAGGQFTQAGNKPSNYFGIYHEAGSGSPTPTPIATATPIPPTATATPISCVPGQFSDVPPDHTFYPYVTCLVDRGVMSGYSDCTFRPQNNLTRGQLSKIVSNAANFTEPHSTQSFEDVTTDHAFYLWIERLASRGIIGGYPCGGENEPCVPPLNRPYFRSGNNVTRGQTSKIVAIAAGLPAPSQGSWTFQDVPGDHTFWQWIEALSAAGAIGGYGCGGEGEPCVPPNNRPYFRVGNNVTRGQASKIVANTFFPGCQTP